MRTKLESKRNPSFEEKQFIRLMESYGKSYVGIKVDTLCKFIFAKELDEFHERELRYYKERYFNYKYINHTPIGKIIARKDRYYLIDNKHTLKEKIQHKAYMDFHCALEELRSTIKTFGKLELEGQTDILDKIMEVE